MKIIDSFDALNSLTETEGLISLTIGNFDGVHCGHRMLLETIKKESPGRQLAVITFKPHPSLILRPKNNFLINTYSERRELLKMAGVDILWEIDFARDFSTLRPEDFLNSYVLKIPNLETIYLGHDFSFGANKTGNEQTVTTVCSPHGIKVISLPSFDKHNICFSSSAIRSEITDGAIDKANNLLCRPYFIQGRIKKGAGRGKQIGFPTANLDFEQVRIIPKNGVYATTTMYKGMIYKSVTNIGHNPTFNTSNEINLETHILDFNSDVYGEDITVHFHKNLRCEKKFTSVNDLISQIKKDIEVVRNGEY